MGAHRLKSPPALESPGHIRPEDNLEGPIPIVCAVKPSSSTGLSPTLHFPSHVRHSTVPTPTHLWASATLDKQDLRP